MNRLPAMLQERDQLRDARSDAIRRLRRRSRERSRCWRALAPAVENWTRRIDRLTAAILRSAA